MPIVNRDDLGPLRPYFDELAGDDESTRLQASQAILGGLDHRPATLVDTVLDRLCTGLASGRQSSRIGFSVTLTEVGEDMWVLRDR